MSLTAKIKTNLKNNYYDLKINGVLFVIFIILFFLMTITKLVWPFNTLELYSNSVKSDLIFNQYSDLNMKFIFSILYFVAIGIIVSLALNFNQNRNNNYSLLFWVLSLGFFFRLIGSFSQNIVYTSDGMIHVGIITEIYEDFNTRNSNSLIPYTLEFFHRLLAIFSSFLGISPYLILLYFLPIIISLIYGISYILIAKKFEMETHKHQKVILVGVLLFCFPFSGVMKFSLTPFALLISLFTLLIALSPYDSILSKSGALFCVLFASFSHVHGLIFVPACFLLFFLFNVKKNSLKAVTLIIVTTFSVYLLIYLGNPYSNPIIYNFLQMIFGNSLGIISYFIGSSNGELERTFIPKITAGGIYGIWYLIQLILFFLYFIAFIYKIYYYMIKYELKDDLTTYQQFELSISILGVYLSTLSFYGLFYGGVTEIWRLSYFTMILGLLIYGNTLVNLYIAIFNSKRFLKIGFRLNVNIMRYKNMLAIISILVMVSSFPILAYYHYSPYNENEISAVEWLEDYINKEGNNIRFFSSQSFRKLFYGLTTLNNVYSNFNNVMVNTPRNLVWTAEYALWELQFHDKNITSLIKSWENDNLLREIYSNNMARIYIIV